MVLYLKPPRRTRIVAVLAFVFMLLGVRWGLSFYGHGEPVAKMVPLSKFHTEKPEIGLMVDMVSAEPEAALSLLTTLERLDATVTFFPDTQWAENNIEMLGDFLEAGHEIGLKGYQDKNLAKLTEDEMGTYLLEVGELFKSFSLDLSPFFYPPKGKFSKGLQEAALEKGYQAVLPVKKASVFWGKPDSWAKKQADSLNSGDTVLIRIEKTKIKPDIKYVSALLNALNEKGLKTVGLGQLTRGMP